MRPRDGDYTASMATDVVLAKQAEASASSYNPSWVNRLIDWIDRLPGPWWVGYALVALVGFILVNIDVGAPRGQSTVGEFSTGTVFWATAAVLVLGIVAHLDRVANASFDAFRPALTASDDEAHRLRYQLTVLPARPTLLIALVAIPLALSFFVGGAFRPDFAGASLPEAALRAAAEISAAVVVLVLVYRTVRQLRQVRRVLTHETRIDLFHPRPLYAFSSLTAQTGIVLVVVVVVAALFGPVGWEEESFVSLYVSWFVALMVLAVAAFVGPLLGLHRRLATERTKLQDESEERLKSVLTEINQEVDTGDLTRASSLGVTLTSLLQQREIVAKLPTWPWSTTTFRAFVSAMMLPAAAFLAQRLLSQVV